ncbi:hypothetical protein BV111_00314B, partial [Haemophilus influenzae]
TLGLPLFKL